MATKKTTITVTTSNARKPRSSGSNARSKKRAKGTLRTGEKLKAKKPVTENPFTWLPWLAVTLSNAAKRARAGRQALAEHGERYNEWSHRKGESMAQNRAARRQRRTERRNNMKGMVECKDCLPDGSSTWHRESEVVKHIDEEHGGSPHNTNRPRNKAKSKAAAAAGGAALGAATAAAARGGQGWYDSTTSAPPSPRSPEDMARARPGTPIPIPDSRTEDVHADIEHQNRKDKEARRRGRQPGKHRKSNDSNNVMKGPWRGSTRGTGSQRSQNWRNAMAGLDGVAEAMNQWASNPPETWEESMADAERAADEFRGMADAFRRRAEAEVEQNNIAPECVEPYQDAATIVSQVADHIMEVASRIRQKYGEVKEMADRGELPRERFLNDGAANNRSAAGAR